MLSQKLSVIQTSNKGQNESSQKPSCSVANFLQIMLRSPSQSDTAVRVIVTYCLLQQKNCLGVKDIVANAAIQEHFTSILTLGTKHTTVKKNPQTLKHRK
jgi:hypothetical protein